MQFCRRINAKCRMDPASGPPPGVDGPAPDASYTRHVHARQSYVHTTPDFIRDVVAARTRHRLITVIRARRGAQYLKTGAASPAGQAPPPRSYAVAGLFVPDVRCGRL